MRARTAGLALLAGIAAFVVVGVAVTDILATEIAFSLLVGIPVGLVAGVAAAAVVLAWLEDPAPGRRRPALAVAGFGASFVVVVVLAAGALSVPNSVAIPVATLVGIVVAGVTYLRTGGHASRL